MQKELNWPDDERKLQEADAKSFLKTMGYSKHDEVSATLMHPILKH